MKVAFSQQFYHKSHQSVISINSCVTCVTDSTRFIAFDFIAIYRKDSLLRWDNTDVEHINRELCAAIYLSMKTASYLYPIVPGEHGKYT